MEEFITPLRRRLAATEEKISEIKESQRKLKESKRALEKQRRATYKQAKGDQERKVKLVGEVVLRRVDRGEWDEVEFRKMMDEALIRAADRALFDLD